ncbi:hypothetical protein V8C42DRAFT_339258 [Trichoderma barbatum]
MNRETRDSGPSLTTADVKDEGLVYNLSKESSGPSSQSQWPRINSTIRKFMRLNQIEMFRDPSEGIDCDLCETPEEKMECILMELEGYRSELIQVALMSTRGTSAGHLAAIVDSHNKLHKKMTEYVEAMVEDAIVDVENHKKRRIKAMKLSLAVDNCTSSTSWFWLLSWFKKPSSEIRVVLDPDAYDGFLYKKARQRTKRIAALNRARELMQKQNVLITMAQDEMVWNPERIFFYCGKIQGRLWTNGLKDEHITKVDGDLWSVQMKWIAEECGLWRPKSINVRGKFGRHDGEKVEWALIDVVCRDRVFNVEILVCDDLFHEEEWCE